MRTKWERYNFRKRRIIEKLALNRGRPRLSVHCSLKHVYAQVIDDIHGKTVAFASSLSKELRGLLRSTKNAEAAKRVGDLVARKAVEAGIKQVRFDRGGRVYHGRVRALADSARQAGLEF